ncbi:UPF0718 protein YcgR [Durusdinium trenchii]|uniref:UPF0718 protein YcgR n=1 Tax=Durusdinium trenchii TaxID=1381693 RepID=A0ABP0KRA0_9DINO
MSNPCPVDSRSIRDTWLANLVILLVVVTGCSDIEEPEHLEHIIPAHKPSSFTSTVEQLAHRGPLVLEGNASPEARQELVDIVGWLPELAADSDLRRPEWERVQSMAQSLAGLLREDNAQASPESRLAEWGQLVEELEAMTEAADSVQFALNGNPEAQQALLSASPFLLAGLIVAGVLCRLIGRDLTVRMFGGSSNRSLLQAWLVGMLLPVCSLGVIPVIRELRRMGLKGGTILAFAMSAPLFNPLSILYGLTLSEPFAIVAFAACSLIMVTGVGLIWDRIYPVSADTASPPPPVGFGVKRMLAIGVMAAREAGGGSALYVLLGLCGVAVLGVIIPAGGLQHAMNGHNPVAPLTMAAVAVPVYATPMLAMSQLGMMFQHANSPGAAFVLLALGAGMNMGLVAWMFLQYGWKRSATWFALLLAVVMGLAYGVDRPLYPAEIDPADHTHAFDIYCRPFTGSVSNAAALAFEKLKRDTQPYEFYAAGILAVIVFSGLCINVFDRNRRIEQWLERQPEEGSSRGIDVVIPGPVLGGIALVGLIAASCVGCYSYYPPPEEVLEEMNIAKAEALGSALSLDEVHSKYWIEIYDDWSRKLEVGAFLRDGHVSDYHRIKGRILREKLELLEHEIEDHDVDRIRALVVQITKSQSRLRRAYLEERGSAG